MPEGRPRGYPTGLGMPAARSGYHSEGLGRFGCLEAFTRSRISTQGATLVADGAPWKG
jgi:hypothetical protein